MLQLFTFFATSLISPFFVEATPEVRSSYVSLGKLLEDRPMMVTSARVGCDAGDFGRFGIRNRTVSSLTDRMSDIRRRCMYHSEFGPAWQYKLELSDSWRLNSDLTRSWTIYRGFNDDNRTSNRTYHWWQIDQSLDNPYLVPFWRLRRTFRGNNYLYFKAGVRRKFPVWENIALVPSVFTEGGSSKCVERIVGKCPRGEKWNEGFASLTFRLELNWTIYKSLSVFAFAEQYMIVGGEERRVNSMSSYRCAHTDWTHGGFGAKIRF
ncbi:MAG: hypothetical protein J6R18_07930 [Kiritimatiellae bacterium]|nr:hypothetical protein [Kiritimatiellia bacterium]